jgi:hypothetical protein
MSPADEDRSVIETVRLIQSGALSPGSLRMEDRRACVEYLASEGYSAQETAALLRVSDRTVLRDRREVRSANAVARDPALVGEMVGKLLGEAETTVSRLRRIGRDKRTAAAVKVQAEQASWQVTRDVVRALQSLGYLPMATAKISADLTHRVGAPGSAPGAMGFDELNAPEYDELAAEIERLQAISGAGGGAPGGGAGGELNMRLEEVQGALRRLSLGERVRGLEAPALRAAREREQEGQKGFAPEDN